MTYDRLFNDFKVIPYFKKTYSFNLNNKIYKLDVSYNIINRHINNQFLYYLIQRYNIYSPGGRKMNIHFCPIKLIYYEPIELSQELIDYLCNGNTTEEKFKIINTIYNDNFMHLNEHFIIND